jgi:hypothetical protein
VRVLVGCEHSARVRDAFRLLGHDAWSVDLESTSGDPAWHLTGDVRLHLNQGWDLLVVFPPCTYLTRANAWRWDSVAEQREEALEFVRELLAAPVPRIALENPAGAITKAIRPPDQYVQPWWFGDPYQKQTGLWLVNLPKLQPEVTERPAEVVPWVQQSSRRGYGGPGSVRDSKSRGLTFPGLAKAMAEQWGGRRKKSLCVGRKGRSDERPTPAVPDWRARARSARWIRSRPTGRADETKANTKEVERNGR